MTTYAEQVRPYINFKSSEEMDKHFNLFRKKHRYELTETDNKVLFVLNGFAFKFPGACKVTPEKVATAAGVSVASVKRAISKATKLGLIKRIPQRKDGGRRQGVTVYQFQRFELELEPQTLSDRENDEKPCESKIQAGKIKVESLILLLPSFKDLKDTKTTKAPEKSEALKNGLLSKLPSVFTKAISPFMSSADDIHRLVGAIFNGKKSIDKSVRVEQHEDLYYKAIVSVFESQKRAERKEKTFNVFAVMFKAIADVTKLIASGNAYKRPETQVNGQAIKVSKEPIPQFMIDNEQDEARKNELLAMKEQQENLIDRNKEQLPDWYGAYKQDQQTKYNQAPVVSNNEEDKDFFARKQAEILAKLND